VSPKDLAAVAARALAMADRSPWWALDVLTLLDEIWRLRRELRAMRQAGAT
jgi:hypothetical protein